jgi:hypothetical protein
LLILLDRLILAFNKFLGCVVPVHVQQMIARGCFYQNRKVSTGRNRQSNFGNFEA